MTLLELQRRMAEDVRRPLTADFEMRDTTDDGASVGAIAASYISPNDRLSSFERLEIYNRQYWFRLISAVSEDFPTLNALLGSKRFDSLILAYLNENPSTSWTLRDLGAKLPSFLEAHPELTGRRHRLAVDVARLEWAYVDAFDRKHRTPLGTAEAQTIGSESRLALQPHLQLLELSYPVDSLGRAVRYSMGTVSSALLPPLSTACSVHRSHPVQMPLLPGVSGSYWKVDETGVIVAGGLSFHELSSPR